MSLGRRSARAVWIVAKKEFMDNVRNRWIVAISGVFVALTLVISYFGAAAAQGRTGFQGLEDTVTGMISIASLLVPILALMLGYAAIVGEREQGSLLLLLAMPVTRLEVALGKFLGLGAVLAVSIVAGLGVSGAVVVAAAGAEGIAGYLAFIGGTIVFALAFLSLALLMSTVARRRSTAIGLAVLTWFLLAVIFDTVLFGLFIATGGTFSLAGGTINLPDWFFAAELIVAPPDAFGYFGFTLFSIEQTFGFRVALPWFVSSGTSLLSLATWTAVPLVLALWRFRRLDL